MQAGNALVRLDRFNRRFDGAVANRRRIGNERGQKARRSIFTMPLGNREHGFGRWLIVQHAPAAAIHLRIDEAGSQNAAIQTLDLMGLAERGFRHNGFDPAIAEHQRALIVKALAVEDTRPCYC